MAQAVKLEQKCLYFCTHYIISARLRRVKEILMLLINEYFCQNSFCISNFPFSQKKRILFSASVQSVNNDDIVCAFNCKMTFRLPLNPALLTVLFCGIVNISSMTDMASLLTRMQNVPNVSSFTTIVLNI